MNSQRLTKLIPMGCIFLLAACSTIRTPDVETPEPGADGCDATSMSYLVGQRITEVNVETLPQPNRIIPHGNFVTMDYRAERMNFELDENDRIIRIYCG